MIKKLERENADLSTNKKVLHFNKVESLLKANEELRMICSSSLSARGYGETFRDTRGELEELAGLRIRVTELSKENDSLKHTLRTSENHSQSPVRTTNEVNNPHYTEDIKKLESELQIYKARNKQLQRENDALKEKIEHMQNDPCIQELESALQNIKEEKASLMRELQQLKQSSQYRQATSPRLTNTNDIELLRQTLAQKNTEIADLKQKWMDLHKYKSLYEAVNYELQLTKENLQKKTAMVEDLNFKTRELRNKEIENKELKKRYFLIRTLGQVFQPRIHNLNMQLDQMQKLINIDEVLDAEIEIRKLLDERDILASQNQRLRAPLEVVLKNLDHLKQQVTGRIEEIDTLTKGLDLDSFEDTQISARSPTERLSVEAAGKLRLLTERASELADFQGRIREFDDLKLSMDQMSKELKQVQDRLKKVPTKCDIEIS